MNENGQEWLDGAFARSWAQGDGMADFLDLPRRIATTLIGADLPEVRLVVDIGSGPGDFLALALDTFPRAQGVWSDLSPAMADLARDRLGSSGRVRFTITDMADLSALPHQVDVIISSRASHHLTAEQLAPFYADAAGHLAAGGWLANLDHVGVLEPWRGRLRGTRTTLFPPRSPSGTHHHTHAQPSIDDHLRGLHAAGFRDYDMPWRGLHTCLFMARNEG